MQHLRGRRNVKSASMRWRLLGGLLYELAEQLWLTMTALSYRNIERKRTCPAKSARATVSERLNEELQIGSGKNVGRPAFTASLHVGVPSDARSVRRPAR